MRRPFPFIYNRFSLVHIATLVALIGSAMYVTPVQATSNIVVNSDKDMTDLSVNDGLCTLREAITNANDDAATYPDCASGSGADMITFAGDYTITLGDQLPYISTEMTITGNGPDRTVIQGPGSIPAFLLAGSNANLTLDQVSIQNGRGIYLDSRPRLTVKNSTFVNNSVGITSRNGIVTLTNTIFSGNKPEGAINANEHTTSINLPWGKLTITDSMFIDNQATGGGLIWLYRNYVDITNTSFLRNQAFRGGAILMRNSDVRVTGGDFTDNNSAQKGGAIYLGGGANAFSSTGTIFSGNTAVSDGGAIYNEGPNSVYIMDSTFTNNKAGSDTTAGAGGAIANGDRLTVTNSTFSGNSATAGGGGIDFIAHSQGTVTNSTFSGNSAPAGGAIRVDLSDVTLTNTIVANSLSGDNCAGGLKDGGHNLDSGTSCKWGAIKGSLRNIDPKLGPLADNGGSTLTFALLGDSPAIDKGDDNVCKSSSDRSSVNGVDQRGVTRPQGAHCDIGAYEVEYRPAISGNVGVAGAILSYTDGTPKTVTADNNGNYSISVPVGWSGTVKPSKSGQKFTPVSQTYSNVQTDQTNQNYTAQPDTGGADTTGVFRPSNGLLYLKNKNESGFADIALNYGTGGDYPVVGDWNGDGTDTIGVYRNGYFYLRNENTNGFAEIVFPFGQAGDQPIAGDWNGDGVDTIGVFRNGTFYLRNTNDAGAPDASFGLGNPGDVGIAGDWDGDGIDSTGVFRPSNGVIFLKNANSTGFADIALNYGMPGDQPVTGDWNNDGTDTIGVYRAGAFYLRNSNTNGFAELIFGLGNPGDMPIAGNWDGLP